VTIVPFAGEGVTRRGRAYTPTLFLAPNCTPYIGIIMLNKCINIHNGARLTLVYKAKINNRWVFCSPERLSWVSERKKCRGG